MDKQKLSLESLFDPLLKLIQEFGSCNDQISFNWVNRRFRKNVHIVRLYNNNNLLTNKYIGNYKHIKYLYVGGINRFVTDNGLKRLNLVELHTNNPKITNITLINMRNTLHTLNINHHSEITDDGVKALVNLRKLYAGYTKITDAGIIDLKLDTLDASGTKISNNGIAHMRLHELIAVGNDNITDEGIKGQKYLRILNATNNDGITDNGIKELELYELAIIDRSKITNKGLGMQKELRELDLQWNQEIDDDGIKDLKKLEYLNASYTKITKKGIADLKLQTLYTIDNGNFDYQIIVGVRVQKNNYC